MLPESKFPVTGGTMQTEEVVPRAQSIGIDSGLRTDGAGLQHHLHHSAHLRCPLPPLIHMAVKQEPQEEEERSRDANTLSPQADAGNAAGTVDGKHAQQIDHHQNQGLDENPALAAPDSGNRGRPSRGRRKSRWKLKFHHQALPPEYLDHYEASLAQENLNSSPPPRVIEPAAPSPAPTSSTSTPSPIADVHGWLQRIAAMQQELCPQVASPQCPTTLAHNPVANARRSVITSASSQAYSTLYPNHNHGQQTQSQTSGRPPMKYSDLPYMGEITLDNSKPRRGRKPKKADICHLIYKNYGTILPGTPGHEEKRLSPRDKQDPRDRVSPQAPFQRTDVQNRISSLLEKRLTQETRRSLALSENSREQDEPLNLCIRDLNQLKIRLLRKHGNVYESGQVKSETSSDGEEVECLGTGLLSEPINYSDPAAHRSNNNLVNHNNNNNNNVIDPMVGQNSGFVYWPNAGVFIHPMALQSQLLYYQKVAQGDKCSPRPTDQPPREQKIVPKSIYNSMMETKSAPQALSTSQTTTPASSSAPPSPRPKRNAPVSQQQGQQPTKRKRSAIFIPPMPTENNNNPATEVSICKFKFTGGAKPSLQEKKSLSVDSGGNFRYYSGTGDKSMRGYEFFPREALQQPASQSGATSAAGAFLSAAGERIQPATCQRSPAGQDDGRRKRKTRKSLQREKLEQTFKEKGFLIQTQQLESAEGATYCKFRQLRKFTRYLFRSWKDYLPGNVRELSVGGGGVAAIDGDAVDVDVDGDAALVHSPLHRGSLLDAPNTFVEDHRTLPLT
ncbi:uncharacterized protein [Linepithema humile]|uniref:uncharacterized protein isoform X1 n=2 Tax=Linepithema humile TaxID=83485 RepID=UPI0006232B42|nr:PREDICTED: uncharacterized protein LOC105674202 isoform X2 [Linepithema humile]